MIIPDTIQELRGVVKIFTWCSVIRYIDRDAGEIGVRPAWSCGTGNCCDNEPPESFFGSLKMEMAHHPIDNTHGQARADIFFCREAFYNRQRCHSTLGYVSPEVYVTTF